MKKIFLALAILVVAFTAARGDDELLLYQQVDHLESILYGEVRAGGMLARLNTVEKDLFGRELPGSLAERQAALIDFLESGANGQPSLLFKLGVAEWVLGQRNGALEPLVRRVPVLEERLEGSSLTDRPLAMRVERLLSLVVSDVVNWEPVTVPQGTVLRLELQDTLSPSRNRRGDPIRFAVTNDLVLGSHLVVSRGSTASGIVTSVRRPSSFGRPSEIKISADAAYPLGPGALSLAMGRNVEEANRIEMSYVAAAGASVAGAVAFGPLGLVGGFFIRGDAREVPAGTVVYAETQEAVTILAYPVPEGLRSMLQPLALPENTQEAPAAENASRRSAIDSL